MHVAGVICSIKRRREGGSRRRPPTSREENKALVSRWLREIFTNGHLRQTNEVFRCGYVLHDPSFPHEVHGPGGIRRYVAAYRAAFPDLRVTVEDQLADEDKVATRWTARGTHLGEFLGLAPTGDEVMVSGIEFDRIIAGRIDEAWIAYHPFAAQVPNLELVGGGLATMQKAFPDLLMAEADSIREGEKVALRWILSGTHEGEFMGVAPTGRRVEAMGMDIVRLAAGEIVEHWGEFDAVGLLRQMGVVP